jgi:hypothetical protein
VGYVLAASFEFVLELRDHRIAVLGIHLIEHPASDHGDACGHQPDGQQQSDHEVQKQFGTKRH